MDGVTQAPGTSSGEDNNNNQYDFTKRRCSRCGSEVEPTFDIESHKYVCPNCGKPM